MKYKVGDKARVRNDLITDTFYGPTAFIESMQCMLGKEVTIKRICGNDYKLEEDPGDYFYSEEMLEDINSKSEMIDKSKYSDEEVLHALELIKNVCNEAEYCENCKLSTRDGICLINELPPTEWEINNEKQIKYLK